MANHWPHHVCDTDSSGGSSSEEDVGANPLDQQGLIPLDRQGLSNGFAMPDPYGLQDYCDSLLPDAPSTDQIIEALELWKFPQEAYPKSK